jgi:hypothetical protein
MNGNQYQQQQYEIDVISPRAVGTLTITAIMKPAGVVDPDSLPTPPNLYPLIGVVQFNTSSGTSGTFDLATRKWTFTP